MGSKERREKKLRSVYLSTRLHDKVSKYAELRGISWNRACEELLGVAFDGVEKDRRLSISEALDSMPEVP